MFRLVRRMLSRAMASGRGLQGDGRGWILIAVAGGWGISLGVRMVFPAMLPQIKEAFVLDNTMGGLLMSGIWLAYATAQFPGGIVGDRFGERNVLTMSMFGSSVCLIVVVFAPTFWAFSAFVLSFGFVTGLYGTTRVTALTDIYPKNGGSAVGLNNAAGNVGATVLPAAAGLLAIRFGWKAAVSVTVPLFVASSMVLWWALPHRTSTASLAERKFTQTLRRVLATVTDRDVIVAAFLMVFMIIVYQAFTAFYPTYLIEQKGFEHNTVTVLYGVFFAGAIVVQPLCGSLADTYGEGPVLLGTAVVTALTLFALPLIDSLVAVGALSLLSCIQLGFWPVVFDYTTSVLPEDVQGSGLGLIRTGYFYLGATGPAMVGILADAGRFDAGFQVLGVLAVLTAVIVISEVI